VAHATISGSANSHGRGSVFGGMFGGSSASATGSASASAGASTTGSGSGSAAGAYDSGYDNQYGNGNSDGYRYGSGSAAAGEGYGYGSPATVSGVASTVIPSPGLATLPAAVNSYYPFPDSPQDPIQAAMQRYGVQLREIFEGKWMKKKFASEFTSRSRFVWIDDETKSFYWSKSEGRDRNNAKGINLATEVALNGVSAKKAQWHIRSKDGASSKSVDMTAENDTIAAAWAKVALMINLQG